MKTLKKCVLIMLVALMLLSLAAPAFAMESRAVVRPCSQCSGGVVTKTESRRYVSSYRQTCSHGGVGFDIYDIYTVTIRESCDSCSYSSEQTIKEHVLVRGPKN